jgi:hypothetical protein
MPAGASGGTTGTSGDNGDSGTGDSAGSDETGEGATGSDDSGLDGDTPDDDQGSGDVPGTDDFGDDLTGEDGTTGNLLDDPNTIPDPEPDVVVGGDNTGTGATGSGTTTGNPGGSTGTDDDTTTDGGIVDDGNTGGGGGGTIVPTSVYTTRGAGNGWEWGVWETEGLLDQVDFKALQPISQSDFTTIATGSMLYDLTGSGVAAYSILHNGNRELVEGTSSIFVQVGQGVTPTWDGDFTMHNTASDSLSFSVFGTIQPDGQLTGSQYNYMMQVHGVNFDASSITSESIVGELVGPGTGPDPISAAVGQFMFDHGGAAQVQGGFGANLSNQN